MFVIDYAFARPNLPAVKAAGYSGVLRYVCPDNAQTHGKLISKAEADAIRAAGLDLTLNFEWYETRPTKGYAAGHADALIADGQADAVGYPRSCAIYYSVDFAATWSEVADYFRGVHDASARPVGVYGGLPIIRAAIDAGLARFGWVTNAASWSGFASWGAVWTAASNDRTHCHLVQHLHSNTPLHVPGSADTDFDPNTVLSVNYGQESRTYGGFLMALSDAEQKVAYDTIVALGQNLLQGVGHSLVNDVLAIVGDPKKTDNRSADAKLTSIEKIVKATKTNLAALDLSAAAPAIADAIVKELPAGTTVDKDAIAQAVVDLLKTKLGA